MLSSELMNGTMGTIGLNNVTEVLNMNRSNVFDTHYYNNIRLSLLVTLGMLSEMGYIIALLFFYYFGDKSSSSHCTLNLFISGLLIGYVPMLIESTFQTEGTDFWKFDSFCAVERLLRVLFAMFSNYMLVILAFNCYNISVRKFWICPKLLSKIFAILVVFYFICSVPSLLAFALSSDRAFITGYRCTYVFSYKDNSYPKQFILLFLLCFVYILPLLLMYVIFTVVLFKLWSRSRYNCIFKAPPHLLSASDVKFVWMTFVMFVTFMITNIPFIFEGLASLFANCALSDPVTAVFLEVLSISNTCFNPYIYLMFEVGNLYKVCVSLIKKDCGGKSVSDIGQDDVDHCKLLSHETANGKFIKVTNNNDASA